MNQVGMRGGELLIGPARGICNVGGVGAVFFWGKIKTAKFERWVGQLFCWWLTDFSYFQEMPKLANIWKWVDINQLKDLEPLRINIPHNENELDSKAPPEDVKVLGIKAIEHVKEKSKL